jgi:ribosome recycling factor
MSSAMGFKVSSFNCSLTTAGRAQPAMLSTIEVDYYGAPTPLQQIASITAPDAERLMINVYDKGAMQAVESAIMSSNLGFTPSNDGKIIRINVPPLTEERRKEMTKIASSAGEDAKV